MINVLENMLMQFQDVCLTNFPKTTLLIGEEGCGKHTFISTIAKKFNIPVEEITEKISFEYILEITLRTFPSFYVIDLDNITLKEENAILKFLEEPSVNSFIILISTNRNKIIPTIENRSYIIEFGSYDNEYLTTLIDKSYENIDLLLSIANTPGKILKYQSYNLQEMITFAEKVLTNISKANIANILTIAERIAFKDEKDKYDFNLFISLLLKISRKLVENDFIKYYHTYTSTSILNTNKNISNIDKKALFYTYLLDLKSEGVS